MPTAPDEERSAKRARILPPQPNGVDAALALDRYLPLGCIRFSKSAEGPENLLDWEEYSASWHALAHTHMPNTPVDDGAPMLPPEIQAGVLDCTALSSIRPLHVAGWIRLRFRALDVTQACLKVYVLPHDYARALVNREDASLCKCMARVLEDIDFSRQAWETGSACKANERDSGYASETETGPSSLLDIFNSLPSPSPDPSLVNSVYQDAMYSVLAGLEGITSIMFAYQRRTTAMMIQREARPELLRDPRLREVTDQTGRTVYIDKRRGRCYLLPQYYTEVQRGGVCAESMGLGKTLICLALIVATRHIPARAPEHCAQMSRGSRRKTGSLVDMAAAAIGRYGISWKHVFDPMDEAAAWDKCKAACSRSLGYYWYHPLTDVREKRKRSQLDGRKIYLCTTSLIVLPPNLVDQWVYEVSKHARSMKVLVLTSHDDKLPGLMQIMSYDALVFSRPRFETEAANLPQIGHQLSCAEPESALGRLRFPRLIFDEGHIFGAQGAAKTKTMTSVDKIHVDSRWIISGTPTSGLHGYSMTPDLQGSPPDGAEVPPLKPHIDQPARHTRPAVASSNLIACQERRNLEKLGSMAKTYFKIRPWSLSSRDEDYASWDRLIVQEWHNACSPQTIELLRTTLQAMLIRHRPQDLLHEVELPPLHQRVVTLEGSLLDKINMNLFAMQIATNAVTSERTDVDYFFHERNRKHLNAICANLRQATFFWTGLGEDAVRQTLESSVTYLNENPNMLVKDRDILQQSIAFGQAFLECDLSLAAIRQHEIPVEVSWTDDARARVALKLSNAPPSISCLTRILATQKIVHNHHGFPTCLLTFMGVMLRKGRWHRSTYPPLRKSSKHPSSISDGHVVRIKKSSAQKLVSNLAASGATYSDIPDHKDTFDCHGANSQVNILSTGSAKLSYLIDQISIYQLQEKILVFYETDNTAYYLAQALEVLNIKHLIYTRKISQARLARYIVNFSHMETFRVLLMDVSLAAFGLDLSSASRVYFITPVFSPQIEAQAIKRAHRIGQTRPVHVETLVLAGSIEEAIVRRRAALTAHQHGEYKTLLDDAEMFTWVREAKFVPLPVASASLPLREQMAPLRTPQHVFGRGAAGVEHPDEDLILDHARARLGHAFIIRHG